MIAHIEIEDEIKFNEMVNKITDIKSLTEVIHSINISINYLRVLFFFYLYNRDVF